MMSHAHRLLLTELRDALTDALNDSTLSEPPPSFLAAADAPAKRAVKPSGGKPLTIPTPLTVAPKAAPVLDDETRIKHYPEALKLARDVLKMVGPGHPQLVPGLKGQLALNRVPFDEQMVQAAIAEAEGR